MLRTVFVIGLFAVLGVAALKLAFGLFTGLLGGLLVLFFWLLGWAIRILIVGLVLYGVIRLVSPDTARRMRERFNAP